MTSLMGTWMQITAQGFLVYELTRSPQYLGYVGFAAGVPTWLLTLYGGVVADRVSRRDLLVITQTFMMLLAFGLAALWFLGIVQPWHIIVMAALLGLGNSFDAPARQAFVNELVPREDLTNAIALNATMFNAATAIGPAIAGLAYAFFGAGWCFIINGLSFIAVIVALRRMKIEALERTARGRGTLGDLIEGVRFVVTHPLIRVIIGIIAATSMFALSLATLIPAWSVNVLGGGAALNGALLSARGIGSLIGALAIASLGRIAFRGRLLTLGTLAYPLLLALFAVLRWIPLSLLVLAGVGMGTIFVMNLANAMVQTSTPDHLRGRVMGAYTWIFFGFMPLGALWTGLMAEHFGETAAVIVNAALAFAFCGAAFLFFPRLRRQ